MTTTTARAADAAPLSDVDRLLVTQKYDGRYRCVGFLTRNGSDYEFSYLAADVDRADFRPLPGLRRAVEGPVRSPDLFPLFAERVISARRPDRPESLAALDLPLDAAPFEVLSRSHGQRVGDSIELLPAPSGSPGDPVSFVFLAHGVRHLPPESQERINTLERGEALRLCAEHDNPRNVRAQLVMDQGEVRLGWVPDPLLDVVDSLEDVQVSVEQANGPGVGYHFRLLVRLQGRVREDLSSGLFTGPRWALRTHEHG